VGESLPNTEIFRRLAARFGFDDPCFQATDADLIDDAIDGDDPRMRGIRPSRLPTDQALLMAFGGGEEAVLFRNVFPRTPSGKVELASDYLQGKYGALLPDYRPYEAPYPLILISPASDRRITSTFGGSRFSDETPALEIHPDDARARGLRDGMTVRVWNDLGEVHLPLKVTDVVHRGVVSTWKGTWFRTSDNGQTVSALVPGHHADISGGACFNDTRVEVTAYR
jgi:anaerobic selenocysteine-containing dehydrogenase